MPNLLYHLIANEVGTSAFLGTLLDPRFDDLIFVQARAAVADLLKRHSVEVSSAAPTVVQLEYLNVDLVAVWSPWILLIENKVASASVTRGQLRDYYAACLLQLERNGFLVDIIPGVSSQPICFIYLTPTSYTGMVEFDTLELLPGRNDKKIHIEWNELLECIAPVIAKAEGRDSWFLQAGAERVRKVILAAKSSRLPESESRVRLQTLMNALKGQVHRSEEIQGLVFHRWSDQLKEQLFATGPARTAYIGIYLSYNGTEFPSANTVKPVGDISFDPASKHRPRLRAVVSSRSPQEWAALLGVNACELHLDSERGSLGWRFSLPEMPVEQFVHSATKRLAMFSSAFNSTLLESVDDATAQSVVAADAPQATRR